MPDRSECEKRIPNLLTKTKFYLPNCRKISDSDQCCENEVDANDQSIQSNGSLCIMFPVTRLPGRAGCNSKHAYMLEYVVEYSSTCTCTQCTIPWNTCTQYTAHAVQHTSSILFVWPPTQSCPSQFHCHHKTIFCNTIVHTRVCSSMHKTDVYCNFLKN